MNANEYNRVNTSPGQSAAGKNSFARKEMGAGDGCAGQARSLPGCLPACGQLEEDKSREAQATRAARYD